MFRELLARVLALLFSPDTEWARIAQAPQAPFQLLVRWVAPLAAIPLFASMIGFTLVGPLFSALAPGFSIRLQDGLTAGLLLSLCSACSVILAALGYRLVTESYGQRIEYRLSFELCARSWAPLWLASILYVVPAWGGFSLIAGLYALWLLYRGLRVLQGLRGQRALARLATLGGILFGTYLVLFLVLAAILRAIFGQGAFL